MEHIKKYKNIKELPSPKGAFMLGHLPQFNVDNKHQVVENWVKECGDLFKIHFVGKPFIVSANHEINQEILKLRPEKFKRYYKITEILEEMGVLGVFNAEGDVWKRHRKPTSEALNKKKVNGYYPIIASKTNSLLAKWSIYAKQEDRVDVQKELMRFTVDITTKVAFGYELDTINNKEDQLQKNLERIFPMINTRITAPIPIWRFIKSKKDKELEASLSYIEQVVHQFIKEARERLKNNPDLKENPSNFLEALLVEQEKDNSFNDKEIYGNVFSMLLAGEDTTSNSISWALYYLAQHPEVVRKVREEAQLVYSEDAVPETHNLLIKLKYATAVVQETLRLQPVTPMLYMQANENIIIQDFHISKNAIVMLQNKVAQTEENYFSNPKQFIPERWIKNECPMHKNHSPEVIKTFGGGSRFCPGMNLAMYEMITVISSICKNFDLKLDVNSNDVKELFSFTMFPENLFLKFKKHNC